MTLILDKKYVKYITNLTITHFYDKMSGNPAAIHSLEINLTYDI